MDRLETWLNVALYPGEQVRQVESTRLARDFMPVLERYQGGYPTDAEARCKLRLVFRIELGEPEARRELRGSLFVRRRHHPAGPAPRSPEIDHQRQVGRRDLAVEGRFAQLERFSGEQQLLAVAAFGAVTEARTRHPVGRGTARADHPHR